jgi:hypothetical protein
LAPLAPARFMTTTKASVRERREGRVLEQGARHEQRAFARAPRIERKPVCAFASASNRSIS